MADKPDKKSDAAGAAGAAGGHAPGGEKKDEGKKGGLLSKTPVMLGGVMLLEAAVLFAGFKFLGGGGPHAASATEAAEQKEGATRAAEKNKTVEVQVLEFRATNKISGRTLLFDVSIFAVVKGENEEAVKSRIADRTALIKDRVSTIIRQSDPEKLGGGSEPGLETLRRQVKYQLDSIIGEGMVEEVLVPRCIPFRADY